MNLWDTGWTKFSAESGFSSREGQQKLGRAIADNLTNKKILVGEAPTGCGKSLAALIPAIVSFKETKSRTMLTTETVSLLDQIVDKDLPMLWKIFGGFTFFGLKGRSHYLCWNRAGHNNSMLHGLRERLIGTNGERRDVEHLLGRLLDDDEWSEISADSDFCSTNQCASEDCYSARARDLASTANIVVTSHRMLQIHGEFIQSTGEPDGLLGLFNHIIVDEAHSLERVVVDGSTLELAPWDMYKKFKNFHKYTEKFSKHVAHFEDLERKVQSGVAMIQSFFEHQAGFDQSTKDWSRESHLIAQVFVRTGSMSAEHRTAFLEYENVLPDLCVQICELAEDLVTTLTKELEDLEKGMGVVRKAISSCGYYQTLFAMIANALQSKTGTIEAYGTTFALFADGLQGRDINNQPKKSLIIRSVPLDVSGFLQRNLWSQVNSVTLISATLKDTASGDFRFLKRSLGLGQEVGEVVVESPFSFKEQQLVYMTDATHPDLVEGARFSMDELKKLILATEGRALVLFTAMNELQYVADSLRNDKNFPYNVYVQENGADKRIIAQDFVRDTHSVLLGSRSFFQGFDVQGESLSSVIQVKFPNPRYDAAMRSSIGYWRTQGFPEYYSMKAQELFLQAAGRGVRSADCKAVVAILDHRVAEAGHGIRKQVESIVNQAYVGSEVTTDIDRVASWIKA